MPNVWECKVRDQWGQERTYTCRGPESEREMRFALARGVLDAQRRRAWETGVDMAKDDPFPDLPKNVENEKFITSVKPVGTDQTTDVGDWQPIGVPVNPFDINRYANRDPQTGEPVFPAAPIPAEVAERGAGVKETPKR